MNDQFIEIMLAVVPKIVVVVVFGKIFALIITSIRTRSVICKNCNSFYQRKNTKKYKKNLYCISCYKKTFNVCDICLNVVNETLTEFKRKKLCDKCLRENKIKCIDCEKIIGKWEAKGISSSFCEDCYNLRYRRFHIINTSRNKLPSSTFKKNHSKRYCGIEIECRNKDRDKNCFIRKELKDLKFSQTKDPSINYGGIEFISRPMNGDSLFNSVDQFCNALHKKDYFVDRSCGLHIHLEIPRKLEYLKKLYLFYEKFEPYIFKMVPKSRQSTSFCMKFDKVYPHKETIIFEIDSLQKFKSMIYETKDPISIKYQTSKKYGDKRYCWTNFHSIFYRGTLEIRSHSGTTSAKKIKNWLELHLTILNYLNKVDLQTINDLRSSKKTFLSLFNPPLQKYIKERWAKFEYNPYAKEGD